MGLPLAASDEPNRYGIQLYHRTATQADLSDKQALEVSCGHGGGASYLVRMLRPASYTGLDINADGIAFCRKTHHLPGLDFVHGDAENLPFPDESFDAVINVEASHGYPRFARSSPKWRACSAREGISSTLISAATWNFRIGRQQWPTPPCGCLRKGSSMRRFCAGWRRIRRGIWT